MPNKEDIIKIKNKEISFEELFSKNIDYSFKQFDYLDDKIIFVTGGGGSIGCILIKRLLEQGSKKIIVLDHSEYAIFKLKLKFKNEIDNKRLYLFLGDIRNIDTIKKIFSKFPIQIVYHTAAYKHIDILESNYEESISVNIKGSLNLLKEASQYNSIEQFIFVSTDKAVNPISNMGISKRITELYLLKEIFQNKNTRNIKIKIIRFGNVFNSSGSVFTIFKYQIENKLPITITSKNMKRYFISKYEASIGMLEITAPINHSGIYILDMGKSLNIDNLLKKLIKKLVLNFTPKITYLEEIPKFEKLEEILYFPFEKIENNIFNYKKIDLINYNMRKIETEIINLMLLLKK